MTGAQTNHEYEMTDAKKIDEYEMTGSQKSHKQDDGCTEEN